MTQAKIATDDIIRVLRSAPQGLTTAQVAAILKQPPLCVSSRLSRLAAYGKIERSLERSTGRVGPPRWSRWRAKPEFPPPLAAVIDSAIQRQANMGAAP